MTSGRTSVCIVLLAAMTAHGSAYAATRAEQTAACRGDAVRLCTLYIPNETKITACMKKKIDKLSPKCRAMFEPSRHSGEKNKSKAK